MRHDGAIPQPAAADLRSSNSCCEQLLRELCGRELLGIMQGLLAGPQLGHSSFLGRRPLLATPSLRVSSSGCCKAVAGADARLSHVCVLCSPPSYVLASWQGTL